MPARTGGHDALARGAAGHRGRSGAITTALSQSLALVVRTQISGHTEMLAERAESKTTHDALSRVRRAGRGPAGLAIVHVTLHMSLADALAALNQKRFLIKSQLVDRL